MNSSLLAKQIAHTLYQAGHTRAGSIVLPDRIIDFSEWVQIQLDEFKIALEKARPYVETCADDDLPNSASEALILVDAAIIKVS